MWPPPPTRRILSGSSVTVALAQPVVGTDGADVLTGNTLRASPASVALDIAAALKDVDGSETLSVTIAGLPADAVLSAGAKQPERVVGADPAELEGLILTRIDGTPTSPSSSRRRPAKATPAARPAVTLDLTVTFDATGIDDNVIDGAGGNDVIEGRPAMMFCPAAQATTTLFIQRPGDGRDSISGGDGYDTVRLEMTAGDVTPAFLEDLKAYETWTEAGAEGPFTFASLGLTIDTTEDLSIAVDGKDISVAELLNVAPVAEAVVALRYRRGRGRKGQRRRLRRQWRRPHLCDRTGPGLRCCHDRPHHGRVHLLARPE